MSIAGELYSHMARTSLVEWIAMLQRTTQWSLLLLAFALSGCQGLQHRRSDVVVLPTEGVPTELCKASIPDYIIEPPDVLTIDAIRILPRQPYNLQPLDSLAVQIVDTDGETLVAATSNIDPAGNLPLGPVFGSVPAGGKTVEQVHALIVNRVAEVYANPMVSVNVVEIAAFQQIAGEHLVGPDGRVNLGLYGEVRVAGMSVREATLAIESHLASQLDHPRVSVSVYGYNSKFYYVIAEGAGLGDQVNKFPYTGNETVIDAISNVEGFAAVSSKRMWIARPGNNCNGTDQLLHIDWQAVSKRGDVTTNYQLLPGDRLFVAEDGLVAYDNQLAKKLAPVERVAGVTLLITQTLQRLIFFEDTAVAFGGGL